MLQRQKLQALRQPRTLTTFSEAFETKYPIKSLTELTSIAHKVYKLIELQKSVCVGVSGVVPIKVNTGEQEATGIDFPRRAP
jgi:hypothetical protein